ncbi:hypothetical protein ACJX0J_040488, partial [Zea mays]
NDQVPHLIHNNIIQLTQMDGYNYTCYEKTLYVLFIVHLSHNDIIQWMDIIIHATRCVTFVFNYIIKKLYMYLYRCMTRLTQFVVVNVNCSGNAKFEQNSGEPNQSPVLTLRSSIGLYTGTGDVKPTRGGKHIHLHLEAVDPVGDPHNIAQ